MTFTTTVASNYTISTTRDGFSGFQVGGATNALLALAEALYVPTCSYTLRSGFVNGRLTAGALGALEVVGRDRYGTQPGM